jgi:uncharacterized protein (DUF1015 family)
VPRFEPFRALRYSSSLPLGDVCAPPYDVLSEHDRERWGVHHELNIVHVDMPIGDESDRYEVAASVLARWIEDGVLVRDDEPSFTLYRMEFVDALGKRRRTVGVLGALEVRDEGAGGVLPHERTTPKAKTDRLQLTRATHANLSPVWGLSLADGLTDALAAPGEEMGRFTDDHGVTHIVERVVDAERLATISKLIAEQPVVIADGHHRYAISRTFRDECRASGVLPGSELTLTYVNELVSDQLSVQAIHRLYRAVDFAELKTHLAKSFDMTHGGAIDPQVLTEIEKRGALALVDASGDVTYMIPKPECFDGVRDLDSARLEHALQGFAHDVAYQHGFHEVMHELNNEQAVAAVFIKPVSVAEIQRTAHEGLLMPPKSTFFTPKLRTGLVVREIEG